ncbi:sialidase-3-like [Epinephelus moara]|uniref:sialidase-3-like n=1 Tax=Epinephelus moara TaxID=300413 RepID=UPI00214F5E73|nr:sialidase-3-like [Epinephelus moara]
MGKQHSRMRPKIDRKTVFGSREKEVYRIPALFYDRDGQILMAFAEKRRTSNDNSSVALVMATGKLEKDETTLEVKWSEMKLVSEAQLCGHRPMNPCPVYEKTSKTLFLFFICVEGTVSEQWQRRLGCNKARLCYITTKDAGQSWSDVTDLTDRLPEIKQWATFAVGPGHGLQTKTNRMIVPVYAYASRSHSCCIGCFRTEPYALALYSDNKGETWHFGKMLKNVSLECEMAEFIDDKNQSIIYCNARTKGDHREEAVSKNNGNSFSNLSGAIKLVETVNGCHESIVSFPAQGEAEDTEGNQNQSPNKWLLFTHPSSKSKRTKLGVYLNRSPGEQNVNAWSKPWVINPGPSGYSDVAYIDDGCFACLMECGKNSEIEQIACRLFSYNEVIQGIGE